ncbi:helix-turn-helix transcriptional regulator [Paenibacillus contaminans]|uniref:AraC family transcriptional regulator n=1 Tax=Paenibacillus contaminans TaxID=450362 RepID=A0A329MKG2_9BACL|nr:helix-turn-helix transcriptional regulator [Paenibacillus contaminans]RAV20132.1 AraC family transcriptional regulator [Paenibacillus contaminans]
MLDIESIRHDNGSEWYEQTDGARSGMTLVMVGYGKCMYWLGQEKLLLEQGDLLLLPAGTAFYGKSIPTRSHEKYVVAFTRTTAPAPLPILETHSCIKQKTGEAELLLERFRSMHRQWHEGLPYRQTMCLALLLEVLTRWNRGIDKGSPAPSKLRHVEMMKSHIQNRYREKITKDDLGNAAGISPSYAAALFKEVTGQTIGEYTHAVRIKTALYLLRHSRLSIADIAESLGYCDASFFHRTFKRLTGLSPSQVMQEREQPLL